MDNEGLQNLPAAERIKRLKVIEENKKKEIAQAQKLIQESEDELTEVKKWEDKVPIPQVAKEDMKDASAAEKEILKAHRGFTEEKKEDKKVEPLPKVKEAALEEMVKDSKFAASPEMMQSQYTLQLSQAPIKNLYQEMANIYKQVQDKGYLNSEEQSRVQYLSSAVEKKSEDVDAGRYSFSENVARAASLTQQLGEKLWGVYKHGKNEMYRSS